MNNQSKQQNENALNSLNPQYLNGFIHGAEMMKTYLEMMSSVRTPLVQTPLVPPAGFPYSMTSTASQSPVASVNFFTNSATSSSVDQSKSPVPIDNSDCKLLPSSPKEMGSSSPRTTKLKSCSHCKATESCCWRKVRSDTGMMCNACFIYERKYKKSRPLSAIKSYNAMKEHN